MLRNCQECNRIFSHPTQRLCPACYKESQDQFTKVKEFLAKNPRATVQQVSEDTEVSVETIYDYIRQGRLSVVPADVKLTCELCDAPVSKGRICERCSKQLQGVPSTTGSEPQENTRKHGKVHLLDKIKDREN